MKLTREEVKKVAKLANLPISEKEEEIFAEQLSKVLGYIDKLNEVDTDGVIPTYNVSPNLNSEAEDEAVSSLIQEEALSNGVNTKNGFFVTKGVFESE